MILADSRANPASPAQITGLKMDNLIRAQLSVF